MPQKKQISKKPLAWITGASQGIGAAVVAEMVAQGWRVAITARSEKKLKDVAQNNKDIFVYGCDITDAQKVENIIDKIEKDLGAIDVAILNAGTYMPETLNEKLDPQKFKIHTDLNVNGTVYCLYPLLEKMKSRQSGHIAIVASVAGYRGLPRSLGYGASKAALINLAESLYMEAKPFGIKIQLINPGFVKTPLTDKNDFEMPFLISAETAAKKLVQGLQSSRFEITFPAVFALILKILGALPNRLYLNLMRYGTKG